MAFDIKAFVVTVVSVIIAAYILNFLGYLKHSSPLAMSSGSVDDVAYESGPTYDRDVYIPVDGAGGASSQTEISPYTIGANEPAAAMLTQSMGGRSFIT